jgi:hypothetical protein
MDLRGKNSFETPIHRRNSVTVRQAKRISIKKEKRILFKIEITQQKKIKVIIKENIPTSKLLLKKLNQEEIKKVNIENIDDFITIKFKQYDINLELSSSDENIIIYLLILIKNLSKKNEFSEIFIRKDSLWKLLLLILIEYGEKTDQKFWIEFIQLGKKKNKIKNIIIIIIIKLKN